MLPYVTTFGLARSQPIVRQYFLSPSSKHELHERYFFVLVCFITSVQFQRPAKSMSWCIKAALAPYTRTKSLSLIEGGGVVASNMSQPGEIVRHSGFQLHSKKTK